MSIAPFRLKMLAKEADDSSELDNHEQDTNWRQSSMPLEQSIFWRGDLVGLQHHEQFTASRNNEVSASADDENFLKSELNQEKLFIKSWLVGQLKAIATQIKETELKSVVIPNEALLHFEVVDQRVEDRALQLFYLLAINFENSNNSEPCDSFELVLDAPSDGIDNLDLAFGKLDLGEPVSLDTTVNNSFSKNVKLTLSSLSWMKTSISDIKKRLFVMLSSAARQMLHRLHCPLPGQLLIYGPRGSGKTALIRAVAKYFEEHKEILAHIVYIDCSKITHEKSKKVRQTIEDRISEALVHVPSIVVFDDLDNIISTPAEPQVSQPSSSTTSLVTFLTDIMDELRDKSLNFCGYGPVAFIASVQKLGNLPEPLTSSGRFDFHVELPNLAGPGRAAILKHEVIQRDLHCADEILSEIASKCEGYDGYDLETLVDRAVHAAAGRAFPSLDASLEDVKPILLKEDFLKAMHDFLPVAMRGLTKVAPGEKSGGWEDVGGLKETRELIIKTIEYPLKAPKFFSQCPIRLRTNILLYGPRGCGKTHIVAAAAAAASLRFITVKGPELLNKYIGASEQAVRDLFAKAAAAAPCLLFFDEFDSIAPKRGHDNTGVTDRVVNQLLTELDGVETLTGVFVFAATNRPDLLDAALLRPGRFDHLLFCGLPDRDERLEILKVLSRKVSIASEVDLQEVAFMTEGFSGADLGSLLVDAELAAVHEVLDSGESTTPKISNELLNSIASKAKPSISEDEMRTLSVIYSQFMNSKKSVSQQARDSKGKRATLA